ncbi:hypothetical protein AFLA_007031 [Aspergillus flavus NRRL3357]|nr:hypothetical protein AFLA_007031 [Aspergillus flavus NRRL3357]
MPLGSMNFKILYLKQVETKLRYTVQVSDMLLRTSFTFIPSSKHLEENSPLQSRNPEETHIWLYCFHIIAL